MARLTHGINGPVRGKAANVVGVKGPNGKNYARSRPAQTVKAQNKALQSQHKNLGEMSALLNKAKRYVEIGFYNSKRKDQQMALAMKYNLLHAILHFDNESAIDYSAVKFSRGKRERVWSEELFFQPGRKLEATWELPELMSMKLLGPDQAKLIMYDANEDSLRHIQTKPIRSDLKLKHQFPEYAIGHTIHAWLFFVSPDGKEVSDSDYLGSGVVLE